MQKELKLIGSLQHFLELTAPAPTKYVHYIIGDWNTAAGSQEIPGVTDKLLLGVQNEAEQGLPWRSSS